MGKQQSKRNSDKPAMGRGSQPSRDAHPDRRSGGGGWVKSLLIAVAIALIIRWVIAEPFRIPSSSMETTLHGDDRLLRGDRVFVNKFVYGLRYPLNGVRIPFTMTRLNYADHRVYELKKPQRFDIVVFKSVEEGALHTTLVKRVIGLPGERVHIEGGKVYINGEPLQLPPNMPDVYYTSPGFGESEMKYGILKDDAHSVVPEDSYLLLGDNSRNSKDGRYFGWVSNEHILGRVSCIWFPPTRWRDFTGFTGSFTWRALIGVLGLLLVIRVFFGRSWRVFAPGAAPATDDERLWPWPFQTRVLHLYINRWSYGLPIPFTMRWIVRWGTRRRGDLVLYRNTRKEPNDPALLLGYVAGMPDERVFLEGGSLMVNNAPVQDPALEAKSFPSGPEIGPYARSKSREYAQVPADHFFLLSSDEDPADDLDSRTIGWVPAKNILGKAGAVWWPPTRWKILK